EIDGLSGYFFSLNRNKKSGCVLTGAERSDPDEPVRSLYDALKPKLCYAYDRYADAYLRIPT
ncbi:hypothetical protein B9Q08_05155, partial [Candidatus Marsarchaeota G2 archaeon ECH_B_SAG-M15]